MRRTSEQVNGPLGLARGVHDTRTHTEPFHPLIAVLADINDELFKFVFRLFDPNNTGMVDADAFVAATALLTKGAEKVEDQVEACFHMFNTNGDGVLTQPEFRAMMEATVALNLHRRISTPNLGSPNFSRSFSLRRLCALRALSTCRVTCVVSVTQDARDEGGAGADGEADAEGVCRGEPPLLEGAPPATWSRVSDARHTQVA